MPRTQLVELYAHGLGVIDDARLEFGEGFNVLTGETGAGKTLLLGALELCIGSDGPSTRHALSARSRAAAVFVDREGHEVVLTREAGTTGRLRSSLDGVASSVEALRMLAGDLIVIHGQHDSLSLRNRSDVLRLLDTSCGVSTSELDGVRRRLSEATAGRARFGGDQASRLREREFADFQIAELEAVKIESANELSDSLEGLNRLSDLRDGQMTLVRVLADLDGESDQAVLSQLAQLIDRIPAGSSFDVARHELRGVLAQARESVHELASLADPDVYDASTIERLEERVAVLQQIARKYGGSLAAASEMLETLQRARQAQFVEERLLGELDTEIGELTARESELGRAARHDREVAAERLTGALRAQLPRVALASATLRFDVAGDDGSFIQILFTPNPGQPEGPLQMLASGGELSRVLLALSLETAHEDVVAVFDEVDAGIGGQVAQQIGDCLREVGRQQQVLAVTHLASVAAKADHHFVVEKLVAEGATTTTVRSVDGEDRVREIARMLAGDEITPQARALALQLLETPR
jgi:DNA repair protein RecN (Recombination protein N)